MNKNLKKKKKKILWKNIVAMIIYEILFIGITGFFITIYGPFQNVKKTFIGTAMSTTTHMYFATLFLSQKQINGLLGNGDGSSDKENLKDVSISYREDSTINEYDVSTSRFSGYILEIKDPKRIKIGLTKKLGITGQTTSQIAEENGAIAAVNGGGFTDKSANGTSFVGTGAYPAGIVVSNGKVITNTYKDSDRFEAIAFDKSGHLIVGNYNTSELLKLNIAEALSFNKTLIINGKPQIHDSDARDGIDPRTAIGQKKDGTVMLLVIDGRSGYKQGATLREVQDLLLSRGAWNAANLDGGSSTTMYYDGALVNTPCDNDGERTVASTVYVTP